MISQEQRQRILDQYSSPAGRSLYRHVMGDGGDHIHYGRYENTDIPMQEALAASCRRLLDLASTRVEGALSRKRQGLRDILDLGAGAGGPAKCLLSWTEATLTCVDIGEAPLRDLERWAAGAGIAPRLRTWNGSFDAMPSEWTGRFDLVWSQDALCHAADRLAVFSEARRVLCPGGALVFSDILLAEDAPEELARPFTAVNVVQHLGTSQAYDSDLRNAGFLEIHCEDWTSHLRSNFLRMRQQIDRRRDAMLREGVGEDLLERFAGALDQRLRWPSGAVLQWRAYCCVPTGGTPTA